MEKQALLYYKIWRMKTRYMESFMPFSSFFFSELKLLQILKKFKNYTFLGRIIFYNFNILEFCISS